MKLKPIRYFLLILWPFFFLFPFVLKILEPGNDFELYYFVYKKYIFEFLKAGHIPFWSPVEMGGYSLVLNPLTQYFYPLAWLFYLISFFIGELTEYTFTIYTLSALSIYNIGQYKLLRKFNIDYKIALLSVLITCEGLRLTELIRFPNALHAAAWFPWILLGITTATTKGNFKKSFILIFIPLIMLMTAGYPYFIFYGFMLFFIYFVFFLFEKNKKFLIFEENINFQSNVKYFLSCLFPALLSMLVCSPWLIKISELMKYTRGRNNPDITFSYIGSSNFIEQLGSWFYPPFSVAEGWYYFGITISVLVIFFILTNLFFLKDQKKNKLLIFLFIIIILINYQFVNPKESLIFEFFWNNIEIIQNFRFWERTTIILVPIYSIIIALSLINFNKYIYGYPPYSKNNRSKFNKIIYLIIFSIFLIQFYFIFYSNYENIFWDSWQLKRIDFIENILPKPIGFFAGLYKNFIYPLTLLFFLIFYFFIRSKNNIFLRSEKTVLITVFLFSSLELFFLSNIQWAIPYGYYDRGYKKLNLSKNYNMHNKNPMEDLNNAFNKKSVSLEKSGSEIHQGNTYYRHNKSFNINYIGNWGMKNHTLLFDKYFYENGKIKFHINPENKKKVLHFFAMDKQAKRIFFTESIKYKNIYEFVENSMFNQNNVLIERIYYNGDKIVLKVNSNKNGWISFIDNWDPGWVAKLNNNITKIDKVFDTYKSVKIEKGQSIIEMEYLPFSSTYKLFNIFF